MKITLVTGNLEKYEDIKRYLGELSPSLEVERINIELPEYQSLDIHKVALSKAEEAWRILQRPILIDDGGIYLNHYNNFPGPLIKICA